MSKLKFLAIIVFCCFFPVLSKAANKQNSLPAVLKADEIDGNREDEIIRAIGNVELKKDGNILFADEILYDKKKEDVEAFGKIKIQNYDIGNVLANKAKVKSDFSSGYFSDAVIVFNDGSYIKSPKITRESKSVTIFKKPIFSICPNDQIKEENELAGKKRDLFSIKSSSTKIDKANNSMTTKHGLVRIYDVPFFYTPYLKNPLPESKRKTGLLTPSYVNTTKLGAGIQIPYYFNIAPNKDLTTTLQYHPGDQHILVGNKYRHLLKNGEYDVNLEIANNRPKSTNFSTSSTNKEVTKDTRFHFKSAGENLFSDEVGLDFDIDYFGDKNYSRDYQNGFEGYTVSQINLDKIKDRDYAGIKMVKTQELEIDRNEKNAPTALPIINYVKTIKPKNSPVGESYELLFNSTFITREDGLQYRRLSAKPEVRIPYNLAGNLFEASANVQGDFYNIENNFKHRTPTNNFDDYATNIRPEADFKWSLPMVGKYKTNTIVIEPLAKIAISSFRNNFNEIPNEDSQDIQLTESNLFLTDRFTGFDRNESGTRVAYGFKSSLFNDKIGQFTLGLGQSWRENSKTQDVVIKGFDEKKSNIVGKLGYETSDIFSIVYNFHLNESSYRNDINEINADLNLGRFLLGSNYILIRESPSNTEKREQLSSSVQFKLTNKLSLNFTNTQDLVNDRAINRRYGFLYDGCCVSYSFIIAEDNPIASSKAQKSFTINFAIKNL